MRLLSEPRDRNRARSGVNRRGAPEWWPDWRGDPCVIVAGGPSTADTPIDLAKGRARFIAIGSSIRAAPWADVLYAHDAGWWQHNAGAPAFTGMKISQDGALQRRFPEWGIRHVYCEKRAYPDRIETTCVRVGWGGNSGFGALNLAYLFGCSPIILVGYDMRLDRGVHWHGPHPESALLCNPTDMHVARWRMAVDSVAPILRRLGVVVLNASPISALRQYRRVDFMELFG